MPNEFFIVSIVLIIIGFGIIILPQITNPRFKNVVNEFGTKTFVDTHPRGDPLQEQNSRIHTILGVTFMAFGSILSLI